jgi:hypothetical protein
MLQADVTVSQHPAKANPVTFQYDKWWPGVYNTLMDYELCTDRLYSLPYYPKDQTPLIAIFLLSLHQRHQS